MKKTWLHNPRNDRCECGHPRDRHGQWHDNAWSRCGTKACLLDACRCQEFTDLIFTEKGTPIRRHGVTGIGKLVGHHLHLHRDYAVEAIQAIKAATPAVGLRLRLAMDYQVGMFPSFEYQCLRLDLRDGLVRFDEAPDFDSAREPHVGKWLLVCHDGYVKTGESNSIWHHKWLWVKPDYQGFEVKESRSWSARYVPLLKEPPRGTDKSWRAQLAQHGL